MNNTEYKNWRTIQIAANILYRFCGNVIVKPSTNPLYDLLVQYQDSELSFAVTVKNSYFANSKAYDSYINNLLNIHPIENAERIPLLLMLVNESDETAKIGFQVAWIKDKIVICKKVSMRATNKKNMQIILDHIKAMDDTIRFLSTYGMKIVKCFDISNEGYDGEIHFAKLIYLRDFSERYKMNQKVIKDEKERFERLLKGIPEGEYPEDDLDKMIRDAIFDRYPNTRLKSSMMLFSSELRDLQIMLRDRTKKEAQFTIIPTIDNQNQTLRSVLNGMQMPSIKADFFLNSQLEDKFFGDLNFICNLPIEGLLVKMNEISVAKNSFHTPSEFLI